ncbi:hypothetical protein GJ496_000002 [Pomphorhynchus laevis]|nr:hypothetical protein GJ496_000002 [Pomphorhynchus laevis]
MKPVNMEDISEVITSAECHPTACNLFAYTSSKGYVRLCDLRTSALCDQNYKLYEVKDDPSSRNFFSEIISSISDIRFDHTGQYMLTRDYMFLKVWDCRQQTGPVEQYSVHPHIKQRLCVMYENDFIFDKFDCSWSNDNSHLVTGSYGNLFTVVNRKSGRVNTYCVSLDNAVAGLQKLNALSTIHNRGEQQNRTAQRLQDQQTYFDELDYSKRILHCSWSAGDNPCLAIAADCNVYFYSNSNPQNFDNEPRHSEDIQCIIPPEHSCNHQDYSEPAADDNREEVVDLLLTEDVDNKEAQAHDVKADAISLLPR